MSKQIKTTLIALFIIAVFMAVPACFAQYDNFRLIEPRKGDEPQPRAVLWSHDKSVALIHYRDEHIIAINDVKLDNEWRIKELKRESIVFGRTSEKRYIEYYIDPTKRPQKSYGTWSFYGLPITLWEMIQLLTDGFGYNAVMHNLCTGAVVPKHNGSNFKELLYNMLPQYTSARLDGDTLYVFPTNPPNEKWIDVLNRKRRFSHKALSIRFPGLANKGIITSVGYDIQYVLRVISLGGEVPISFPKDMHFAVYANFKKVPFSKILCDIVYTNQCIVVEREAGLEVIPWPGKPERPEKQNVKVREPVPLPPLRNDLITVDPVYYDEKSGSGPYPPPLVADPRVAPSVVYGPMGFFSDEKGHPIVVQPYSPASITSRLSGDYRW